MKREVIPFRKIIPKASKDVLAVRVKAQGTVDNLRVRFYQGQAKSLQVRPFIEHKGHQIEEMLYYPATADQFISGDNDYFEYNISIPVDYDDHIKIQATNITNNDDGAIDWASGVSKSVGDKVYPTSKNGFYFECITAGTTGTSEPDWDGADNELEEGDIITDNTVEWKALEVGYDYTLAVDVMVDYLGGKNRVVS